MLTSVLDFLSMIAGMVMACAAGLVLAGGFVLLKLLGTSCFRAGGGMLFVFLAMGLGGWLDGSVTSPYAWSLRPDGGGKLEGKRACGKSPVNGVLSVFSGK